MKKPLLFYFFERINIPFANILLKYLLFVGGMAAFMVAVMHLESIGEKDAFIAAVSFSLGIFCGDTNTLTFYQTLLKINGRFDFRYYIIERAALTIPLSIFVAVVIPNVEFNYFIYGALLAFILPQGRVSNSYTFGHVVIFGGALKIALSAYILKYSGNNNDLKYLICAAVSSNYLASVPFHIKNAKIKDCPKLNGEFTQAFRYLTKSFILTLPIHFYTSLAPFFYIEIKGSDDLAKYYLYDKLVRGLGATVIGLQSSTTNKVSLMIANFQLQTNRSKIFKLYLIYLVAGLSIGFMFILTGPILFDIMHVDISLFNNAILWIFVLTTAAMYISNFVGIQILMTMGKISFVTYSSLFASIVFCLSLPYFKNPLLIVALPEIAVSIFQTGVFYALFLAYKRKG